MQARLRGNLRQLWVLILLVLMAFVSTVHSLAAPGSATAAQPEPTVTDARAAESQGQNYASVAKSDQIKPKKGGKELLWKMTSDSGVTLYLLGTIHVFKPEDYPLPDEMEKAFAKARALIVEVDLSKADPNFAQSFMAEHGKYPPSDSLTEHLSSNGIKLLHEYCAKRNFPFAMLVRVKPWFAALTVLQMELARLGYVPTSGIDLHFLNEANKQGKEIISLETMEFQLNLFANLPDDLQEMDLDLALVDLGKLETDAGYMMKAWREGDDKSMDELMTRDIKEHPELAPVQEKLVYERNVTMAQKLETYLKAGKDTYMVAIGSGHLVGDRSVIALLKQRGYRVTQVIAGDAI